IEQRRIFARITFWCWPVVIFGQDESGCGGVCKSTRWWWNIELRIEIGYLPADLTLLTVRLKPQSHIDGESWRDLPVVNREKMGRGRAQSDVRDRGSAQFKENIGERCAIATSADSTCRQTKQEIRKGKDGERSVCAIRAFIEMISEYLRSKTKIVLTFRQRQGIRKIEIVVRRFILIVWRISQLETAQYLDVRQASHLRVADTIYPHCLGRQRARG